MSQINIMPMPKNVEIGNKKISIGKLTEPMVAFSAEGDKSEIFDEAIKLIKNGICEKLVTDDIPQSGAYEIKLLIDENYEALCGSESYFISVEEKGAIICGYDAPGAYYGAVTFLKLMEEENNEWYLPVIKISDYPSFKKRGHFAESRCGSEFTELEEWKKIIDYIADNKCNTLIVSIHGCWTRQWDFLISEHLHIPINKYPELKTPRHIKYYSPTEEKWVYKKDVLPSMAEKDFFGDIIAYGKRKNVEVIPLFNSYGHNTMIPKIFPQMSAKDKMGNDTGFSICTECDETYEIMFNIYDEIIEKYLKPNGIKSFHIGMDEVMPLISIDEDDYEKELSPFCECEKCRPFSHGELVMRFIVRAVKHLKEMGMKNVYIYHDILLRNGLEEEKLLKTLKDEDILDVVVIDWWSYSWIKGSQFGGKADKVSTCFRSVMKPWTGYYHWDVIEDTFVNINDMTHLAEEKGFEGVITYDGFEYCFDKNLSYLAEGAWNGSKMISIEDFNREYALCRFSKNKENAIEAMEKLSLLTERTTPKGMDNVYFGKFLYYTYTYVRFNKDKGYRTAFPEEMFKYYYENPKAVTEYLEEKIKLSDSVLNLLADDRSKISEIHKTTAMMYKVPANEIIQIATLTEKLNKGEISCSYMAEKLSEMLQDRMELMRMVEKTRIPGNNIYLLRSLSVSMQYIEDIKCFLEKMSSEKKNVKLDLTNLESIKSEMSYFLR